MGGSHESTSGTQYAIVLSDSTDQNGQYLWGGSDTANYQGGSGESNRGPGWLVEPPSANGPVDFVFQTYVETAPLSVSQCSHGGWQAFPQFTSQKQCAQAAKG